MTTTNVRKAPIGIDVQRLPQTHPQKVLLVEDSPIVQQVNALCLRQLGCQVLVASTGEQALSLFDESIDLVLLDLSLGEGLDGYAVARLIRKFYPELTTPIMACTSQDAGVLGDCLAAGMTGFVEKPFLLKQVGDISSARL